MAAEDSIEARQAAQKRAAEHGAQRSAATEETRAELDAQHQIQRAKADEHDENRDATEEVVDAAARHRTSVQVARNENSEADRLRRHAHDVTDEADLP